MVARHDVSLLFLLIKKKKSSLITEDCNHFLFWHQLFVFSVIRYYCVNNYDWWYIHIAISVTYTCN